MDRSFNVLVIGKNPDKIMEKYCMDFEVEPYILYRFDEHEKLYNEKLLLYKTVLESKDNSFDVETIKQASLVYKKLKEVTPFEYYQELIKYYNIDENGNALTTENPYGKWEIKQLYPCLMIGNDEVSQANIKEINWEELHLKENKLGLYKRTWELCFEKQEPEDDLDKILIQNMGGASLSYFERFNDKEEYAKYNTSFGFYAIATDKKWEELQPGESEFDWYINFYDKFIKKLKPTTLLTSYTCSR